MRFRTYQNLRVVVALVLGAIAANAYTADLDEAILRLLEGDDPGLRSDVVAPTQKQRTNVGAGVAKDANSGSTPLTLFDLGRMAQENDPLVKAWLEKSSAFEQQAGAAEHLPDPKLKFGIKDYPTQSVAGEPDVVSVVVGVQQEVMPKRRRDHESARMLRMGDAQAARAAKQKLVALRDARKAWLNVYLKYHTVVIVRQNQKLLAQIQQVTQYQYRSGSGSQSDVLQAQVELSVLKDRESSVETEREVALAELAKWVGPVVFNRPLALDTLDLPGLPSAAKLVQALDGHPALTVMNAETEAAKESVELTRALAKPAWMWELEAMWASTDGSGFENKSASAFITVELPFFKKNLQDRWLAASEKDYNSALFLAADEKRELKRALDQESANWKRLDERLTFYRDVILPQAAQNAQATLRAYQAQVADFTRLMRARQMELDSKLEALRLLVEQATAHVNLLYLSGDGS